MEDSRVNVERWELGVKAEGWGTTGEKKVERWMTTGVNA
jgi:hypothetical protein